MQVEMTLSGEHGCQVRTWSGTPPLTIAVPILPLSTGRQRLRRDPPLYRSTVLPFAVAVAACGLPHHRYHATAPAFGCSVSSLGRCGLRKRRQTV